MASGKTSSDDPTTLDLDSLRALKDSLDHVVYALQRLEYFQNYGGKIEQSFRRSGIQKHWTRAKQAATRVAAILGNGTRLQYPVSIHDVDEQGCRVTRTNSKIVAGMLGAIWDKTSWLSEADRISSNMDAVYSLTRITVALQKDSKKLAALIRSEEFTKHCG